MKTNISGGNTTTSITTISDETRDILIDEWMRLISNRYGIHNIENYHQCHSEKPPSIIKPFHLNYFYGCIICGKFHICYPNSQADDCELVSVPDNDTMICRFSGRCTDRANYAIGYKESSLLESDINHGINFERHANQDINLYHVSDRKFKSNSSSGGGSGGNSGTSGLLDDRYTHQFHENRDGSFGSYIKKKPTHFINSVKEVNNTSTQNDQNPTSRKRKRQSSTTSCIKGTIVSTSYPSNIPITMVPDDKSGSIDDELCDKDDHDEDDLKINSYDSLEDEYHDIMTFFDGDEDDDEEFGSGRVRTRHEDNVDDDDNDEEDGKNVDDISIKKNNKRKRKYHEEEEEEEIIRNHKKKKVDLNDDESGAENGEKKPSSAEEDKVGHVGDGGGFTMEKDDEGYSMVFNDVQEHEDDDYNDMEQRLEDVLFMESQLNTTSMRNTHNNIAYWNNYYSFIELDDYSDDEVYDNSSLSSTSTTTIQTTKKSPQHTNGERSSTDSPYNYDELEQEKFEFMIGYEELKKKKQSERCDNVDDVNNITTPPIKESIENENFRKTITSDVSTQIDEELVRLLNILLIEFDRNLQHSDAAAKQRQKSSWWTQKERQTIIDKLKHFYGPIISRIVDLIYNSPLLLEWAKDKNIKHQKQVKSSCLSKESTSVTNLSNLEETERNLNNSMDTILCPKKICQCLLLKHFLHPFDLYDADKRCINIWSSDLWLYDLHDKGIIEDLFAEDEEGHRDNEEEYSNIVDGNGDKENNISPFYHGINQSSYHTLRKIVNEDAKVIKLVLGYYENDPIWLKSFIFK
jgi:hypothetical protein